MRAVHEEPPHHGQAAEFLRQPFLDTLGARYKFVPQARFHSVKAGLTSNTWIATSPGGRRVVLRRYPAVFDESWIHFEHSILRHLKAHGFPVPGVIPADNYAPFVRLDDRHYAVFEYCQGYAMTPLVLRRLRPDLIASAGRTLAWYHQLMEGFQPEGREIVAGVDYRWCVEELRRYHTMVQSQRPPSGHDRFFLQQVESIERQLHALGVAIEHSMARCPSTVIHSNFNPEHTLYRRGQIIGVLDFTNAHRDARVADVAHTLIAFSRGFGQRLNLPAGRRLLRAYQERLQLTPDERALLPAWMQFDRLRSVWWKLKQYYEEGRPQFARGFARNVQLARWIEANAGRIRALCETDGGVAS